LGNCPAAAGRAATFDRGCNTGGLAQFLE